jgi:tetratricopeptide (TPR) repeat protein
MSPNERRFGSRVGRMMTPEEYEAAWRARQNWVSPWKLVRENRLEEALEIFKKDRGETPPYKPGLGQVLMCAGQYELAADLFGEAIETPQKGFQIRSETDYAFLGTARWCLQDYPSAFRHWRGGINAPYAIGGICTQTPLLLFAGSVLRPDYHNRTEAEEILRTKLSDPRAGERTEHWPASLGKLVLGTIPKGAMAAWWVRTTPLYEVVMEHHRQWLTEFYDAVLALSCSKVTLQDFRASMRRLTEPSRFSDWELNQWELLMRSPEFYLAQFEGSQTGE